MNEFTELLQSWHDFYFMLGGASASLIGLMIVALSLGTHLLNDNTRADIENFASPSIFYFMSTLLIAGGMLVPVHVPLSLAVVLLIGGSLGLLRTIRYVRGLIRAAIAHQDFDLQDWIMQVVGPLVSYGLLLLTALGLVLAQWNLALVGVCAAALLLILCAIANTWSMVLWIIEHYRAL
jgi:hypothetical protein